MGSLFKTPKYEPPKEMASTNKLLDEREARAEAAEKKEKRKIAAKARTRRAGGRLLFSQDRAIPQLGVGGNLSSVQSYSRNPYEDERMV
jgi:hypothetical protein